MKKFFKKVFVMEKRGRFLGKYWEKSNFLFCPFK